MKDAALPVVFQLPVIRRRRMFLCHSRRDNG